MTRIRSVFSIAGALVALAFILSCVPADVDAQASNQSEQYFSPNRLREDFTAGAAQTVFISRNPPRGGYVEVYRNGSLMRKGKDYTVGNSPTFRVTFTGMPVRDGDDVTLFYYPNN